MKNKINQCMRLVCVMLMVMLCQDMLAQGKAVSGTVTDGGEPLVGVTVAVKGNSRQGTVTDLDGHYTLQGVNASTILVFSYVGYDTAERMVGEKSTIDIVLKQSAENLNEVVVVGYGTMKKSDLTGSVSQLKAENFKAGNELSAQQLMQGAFAV
jgi:iron complex outermembrane receptor protein